MNGIALCQIETVEVLMPDGPTPVFGAHRFGDFAAHRGIHPWTRDEWRVTHLPTGLRVASSFPSADWACDAMIEIARLRNDWAVFSKEDRDESLAAQIKRIAERHFGTFERGSAPNKFQSRLNGYADLGIGRGPS